MSFTSFNCVLLVALTLVSSGYGNSPLQLTRDGQTLTSSPLDDFHKVIRVPSPQYRLPNQVLPYHYDIRLRPRLTYDPSDLPQWTAPSQVTIFSTCVDPTRNISLHSTVREISESSVTVINIETGLAIPVEAHSYDSDKNFYIITLQSTLQIGQRYKIVIDYLADVHTNRMDGLYRSHYDDPLSGETKWYATTQFQAFGARSAFPCFDEPALKATFNITIGRKTNFSVISNTPLIDTTPIPGLNDWVWDTFKQTVPMPTYLVALIVSDYTYAEASRDLYKKQTRTYGPKFLIDQGNGDFAAKTAAMQLAYFEDFFAAEYALDKMDSAAMWDFGAGAMENWGLNIYRDYLLLYAPDQNNERERRQIAQTLAHELAHQWFGNLVTCGWWTGAWLNEGFASYIQYLGLNHTNPEFESLKTNQNDAMQNAMRSDYLPNSHPTLLPDKGNPYDTMSYNANLVYSKGAALMRMVENFLTIGTLQTALRKYLDRYAFGAVYQDDLFEVLTEQALEDKRLPEGITMKDIMDTWTLQKSYPLLKVKHHTGEDTVTITQEEDSVLFRGSNSATPNQEENSIWYVPMAVATQSNPQPGNTFPQYWLSTKESTIPHKSAEWIVINSGATGYYRVEYDAVLTQRLHDQLKANHEAFNYGTRSQLLDDYFTRAYTGNQQIAAALGFTQHFSKETEYVVWAPFFFHMAKPYRLFAGTEVHDALQKYILPKISSVLQELRENHDISTGIDNLLHAQLFDWACAMGELRCVNDSLQLFEQWKSNPGTNPIQPLLRKVVYCTAIANRVDNFQFALERFEASTGTQKTDLLAALGCTTDAASIKLLLGAADGSSSLISKQFALAALQSVGANHMHRGVLSSFLDDSIREVVEYYGDATIIANSIKSLSSYFATSEDLAFVSALAVQHADLLGEPGIAEIIEASLGAIEENILWMARFREQFHKWFEQNGHFANF